MTYAHPSFAAVICVMGMAGLAAAQEPQRYTSTSGHFSITFPGPFEESSDTTVLGDGRVLTVNMASYAPSDEVVYMTSWVDMRDILSDDASVTNLLVNSRDGSTNSMGATRVNTVAMDATSDRPFIEFTFATEDLVGKERIYMVDNYQYALMTIFSKAMGVPSSADDFIRSFKAGGRLK